MRCPFCRFGDTQVIDSRPIQDGRSIRRRRECPKCQARFSTYEEAEIFRLQVEKRDGRKEEYSREKLEDGLRRALKKRPNAEEKLARAMREIEASLHARGGGQITSRDIGKFVMRALRDEDEVAYIRFASVYKAFGSAKSFQKEVEKLEDEED